VSEKRVLRIIFVPKKNEVTGESRKLQNWELNDLNYSPSIFLENKCRQIRWARREARMGERRSVLWGKSDRKRPLGRRRHR
jgi:hypothetical protein